MLVAEDHRLSQTPTEVFASALHWGFPSHRPLNRNELLSQVMDPPLFGYHVYKFNSEFRMALKYGTVLYQPRKTTVRL